MDDIKDRLTRIEGQNTTAIVEQKVMNHSFKSHSEQNERDFQHVDDCIHRTETESRSRDADILSEVKTIKADVAELKMFMWRASGALLVLVPVVNHLVSKFL